MGAGSNGWLAGGERAACRSLPDQQKGAGVQVSVLLTLPLPSGLCLGTSRTFCCVLSGQHHALSSLGVEKAVWATTTPCTPPPPALSDARGPVGHGFFSEGLCWTERAPWVPPVDRSPQLQPLGGICFALREIT